MRRFPPPLFPPPCPLCCSPTDIGCECPDATPLLSGIDILGEGFVIVLPCPEPLGRWLQVAALCTLLVWRKLNGR